MPRRSKTSSSSSTSSSSIIGTGGGIMGTGVFGHFGSINQCPADNTSFFCQFSRIFSMIMMVLTLLFIVFILYTLARAFLPALAKRSGRR
jgi:hypothetical protein